MINRFMISVAAAALIAGTGFANAQGMGREGGGSSGSSMQQSAPSSERGNSAASERGGSGSAAPMNRDATEPSGNSSDTKSTQSEEKSPAGAKNQRAQDNNMQGQKPGSKSSDNATKDSTTKGGGKDMKAEGRGNADDSRNAEKNADSKNGADQKGDQKSATDSRSQTTVGQAGAGAKLSSEQRTKITTVIKNQHVAPVTNVNFSISVGTRVPRDVSFRPLPAEVVTIYPEWRGYNFVLVREQIIVIDPETFEIVAVIDA
jgi:Protein of unknown function (DUF1236)